MRLADLPCEVRQVIRQFASGKRPLTPTAAIMRHVNFNYESETDEYYGVYEPDRLIVTAIPPTRFINTLGIRRHPYPHTRVYILDDFIPSYWSDYANTFDHCY